MSLTSTCGLPEVAVAAEYWANLIDSDGLSAPQLMMFKESLMRGMIGKFNGHWFPQNRERGSAFRSFLFDQYSCPRLVLNAASESRILDLPSRLPSHPFVMWIDPGFVSIKSLVTNQVRSLYEDASAASAAGLSSRMSAKARSFAPSAANCSTEYAAAYYPSYEGVSYHQMVGTAQRSD